LTIRKLDESLKAKLRVRAASKGHSMEEEARAILRIVLSGPDPDEENLFASIRRRIEVIGGVDLDIPPRDPPRPFPDFE
jgi:plasmid stability protein